MRNTGMHDVHTDNNGMRGVRSIDIAQRNFVGARNVGICC
jgi:hypothetical protein